MTYTTLVEGGLQSSQALRTLAEEEFNATELRFIFFCNDFYVREEKNITGN